MVALGTACQKSITSYMPEQSTNSDEGWFGELPETQRSKPEAKQDLPDEKQQFDWSSWRSKLPPLKAHSIAKLEVLRSYIEDYIVILCTGNPGQDRFRLTVVDGFAGGGIYEGQKVGSPFVLLEAVKVAEQFLTERKAQAEFISGQLKSSPEEE